MANFKYIWLTEQQAADYLGYKPRTLRKHVLSGKLNIVFTTIQGRKFHYNKVDIDRLLLQHSNA